MGGDRGGKWTTGKNILGRGTYVMQFVLNECFIHQQSTLIYELTKTHLKMICTDKYAMTLSIYATGKNTHGVIMSVCI